MDSRELVLAENGASPYRIVVAEDAILAERHAAEELRRFLLQAAGADLPVCGDGSGMEEYEIVVGENAHSRLLGLDVASEGLGGEGFVIRAVGNRVVIAGGKPRGTLYGVYEFLERYAGCRWFTSKVSRVPRLPRLALPPIDLKIVPALEYREVFYTDAFDGDWAARNRMNGQHHRLDETHGGKLVYTGFVHTFDSLVPVKEHFDSHPEYFSMVDGERLREHTQLCLTNEDVFALALAGVKRWIAENPGTKIVSVSQNDCYNPCQCPACSALDEKEGSQSGSLIHFVNRIAGAVGKEYPDVLIDTLAYNYTRKPPKHAVPAPNVVVRLCSIECCFAHPLNECREISYPYKGRIPDDSSFAGDIQGWSKICRRLYVWDYVTNFSNYLMPFPNFRVLQPNVRFLERHHVRGIFEEGNFSEGGCGEFAELRAYVLARLLWDADADVEAAIGEFLGAYYGGAAPYIRTYLDLLHDRTAAGGFHFGIYDQPTAEYLDDGLIAESLALMDKAAQAAVGDELRRVGIARLPLEFTRLSRLPADDPGRVEAVKAFFADLREFGVTEIKEGRGLTESEELFIP